MDKNAWEGFERLLQKSNWEETHPNAKKGKPISLGGFYEKARNLQNSIS